MIHHKHRYNHLRKYVYTPNLRQPKFIGLDTAPKTQSLCSSPNFTFVHPVAALKLRSKIPEDLTLEARDCFSLYQTMVVATQGTIEEKKIIDLAPKTFFLKHLI